MAVESSYLFGYLFESNIRLSNKYFSWFTLPFIGLFGILLWIEAIKHTLSLPFLVLAFLWSCFIVWIVWRYSCVHNIASLEYACTQNCVINKYKDQENRLYLDNTIFLTLVTVEFSYGKGVQKRNFYILSNTPISSHAISHSQGLLLFKKLLKQGMIAIPKNVSTQAWISDTLGIKRISEYPVISCYRTAGHGTRGQQNRHFVSQEM